MKMMNKFEQARQKYKPDKIKYLLIAETPPKLSSNRFFYFEEVSDKDSLFWETMKVLYPEKIENIPIKVLRLKKKYFLDLFKNDGFYLIDSLEIPFEKKYSSQQKIKLIKSGQDKLYDKIKSICDNETKIILIAVPVYKANYKFLRDKNVNVINTEQIDFPGSGGQLKFRMKFSNILSLN